jgi:hypothetical protein
MERHLIIHRFHSQVPDTISEIRRENGIETVVCFDSNVDTGIVTSEETTSLKDLEKLAALRMCSHLLIKRAVSGVFPVVPTNHRESDAVMNKFLGEKSTNIALVIPAKCLESQRADMQKMEEDFDSAVSGSDRATISLLETTLGKAMGAQILASPPFPLDQLVKTIKHEKNVLIDIDMDYMQEFQSECYSQAEGVLPSELGLVSQVMKALDKIKPRWVTISEASVAANSDPKSRFVKLLVDLKGRGYSLSFDERNVTSDDEARRALDVWRASGEAKARRSYARKLAALQRSGMFR